VQRAAAPGPAELLRFRERLERAARELTHDYDELLGRLSYAAVPTTTGPSISFARGAPSLDIVDVEGLKEAARRAFESDPAGTTAYGTSIGYPRLRSWIADRHGVEPERVLVTNGSMQADAFLFESLVSPGAEVVVERPSYDRTLLSLRGRGAQLHAVQLEPDGIDTHALGALLAGGARPKLAHIIPNFQNPAGYTLSLAKRRHLLQLAAEHDFVVFEDDPYVALRFSGETLPTMLSMDPKRVVYASSFSKTVCPGIRVGYLVGPAELIASIAKLATNTYISPNMVAQSIVYEFSASGAIERSIETVKAALAERAARLADSLRRELPEAQFVEPQGGYFMWVTLPEGTDVARLFSAAAERGVAFVKGTDFLLEGGENTLRLAYSGVTPEQIEEGVARLAEAYRSL
jgi:DNA-binding transcriptional MocR family regulator